MRLDAFTRDLLVLCDDADRKQTGYAPNPDRLLPDSHGILQ
jgi:hypothetical protein